MLPQSPPYSATLPTLQTQTSATSMPQFPATRAPPPGYNRYPSATSLAPSDDYMPTDLSQCKTSTPSIPTTLAQEPLEYRRYTSNDSLPSVARPVLDTAIEEDACGALNLSSRSIRTSTSTDPTRPASTSSRTPSVTEPDN